MTIKSLQTIALFSFLASGLLSCNSRETREVINPLTNKPMEKYEVRETDDGSFLKDGYYKKWHMNGQIEIDCNYKLNKRDGVYKKYYENGQIEFDTNYKNDSTDGHHIKYYKNGKKNWEGEFSSGKEVGVWNNWYENGQQKAILNYNQGGKLNGEQKYWYSNGQVSLIASYNNDEKIGSWTESDEDGQLMRIYKYENGKDVTIVGKWQIDNGNIIEYLPDNTFLLIDKKGRKTKGEFEIKDGILRLSNSTGFGGGRYKIERLTDNEYQFKEQGYIFSGDGRYKAKRI